MAGSCAGDVLRVAALRTPVMNTGQSYLSAELSPGGLPPEKLSHTQQSVIRTQFSRRAPLSFPTCADCFHPSSRLRVSGYPDVGNGRIRRKRENPLSGAITCGFFDPDTRLASIWANPKFENLVRNSSANAWNESNFRVGRNNFICLDIQTQHLSRRFPLTLARFCVSRWVESSSGPFSQVHGA